MKDYLSQITEPIESIIGMSLFDAHNYWLKKRIVFNITVGMVGLLATVIYARIFTLYDFIGILMWGFVANGLYSFGYVLESYMITKYPKVKIANYRKYFFWVGTLLYCLISFLFAQNYFQNFEPFV